MFQKIGFSFTLFLFFSLNLIGQNLRFDWMKQIGGIEYDNVLETSINQNDGSIVVCGKFDKKLNFDASPTVVSDTSKGWTDAFIVKYDSSGNYLWHHTFGSSLSDVGLLLATDNFGNIYFSGAFFGNVDFDPSVVNSYYLNTGDEGYSGRFIVKFDSLGNFLWAKKIDVANNAGGETIRQIEIDRTGNLVITGNFTGGLEISPGTIINSTPDGNLFIVKYSPIGVIKFVKQLNCYSLIAANGLKIDFQNNIIIAGTFQDSIEVDPLPSVTKMMRSNGSYDAFFLKYDSIGNYLWHINYGNDKSDKFAAFDIDDQNNIYAVGSFTGTVDFNPSPAASYTLNANGSKYDVYLIKFTPSGSFSFVKRQIAGGIINYYDLKFDAPANLIMTGDLFGTNYFNFNYNTTNAITTNNQSSEAFVSKYTITGGYVWAGILGGINGAFAKSVAVDKYHNVYVTGDYYGLCDFDPGTNTFNSIGNAFGSDVFLTKLSMGLAITTKDNEFVNHKIFRLYRNPTNDYVELENIANEKIEVQVFNTQGKQLDFKEEKTNNSSKIYIDQYSSGIYFIKIISKDSQTIEKIIKY